MSWLYLPGQDLDCLPVNGCLDIESCAMSKKIGTELKFSKPELEMDISTMRPSGETLEHSTGNPGVDAWILSLRASRANRSPVEVSGEEKRMSAMDGRIPFALFERYNPRGYFWKTAQTSLTFLENTNSPVISKPLLKSFPKRGIWVHGVVYRLPAWERYTKGSGCGLLPTPVKGDGKSFYVATRRSAERVLRKDYGASSAQMHWMMYGVISQDLKKGWANPAFGELMMGCPIGWSDLKPLGMGKFQQWLDSHGDF